MVACLSNYSTIVFDCDGVLLNSNRVKTDAFRTVASQFSEEAAEALVYFHVNHGGISRYRKFEYLLTEILKRAAGKDEIQKLADEYGNCVFQQLLCCQIADDLAQLRAETSHATWMVVSGGAEFELHQVFNERGISSLFDGGIYGSPATKDEILSRQIDAGRIRQPAIFLGDSRYDHEAATSAGLDFVFVHGWTEFQAWEGYCDDRNIQSVRWIKDLRN